MVVFLSLAVVGGVLLLGGLLLGGHLDGHLEALSGALPETPLTTPALGAALSAFGVAGALATSSGAGAAPAAGAGLLAAVVVAVAAAWLTRIVIGAETPPVRTPDLLGRFGTVVTRVPPGGLGEVSLAVGGARVKLAARTCRPTATGLDPPLPAGTRVYVLAALSATCVVVAPVPLVLGRDLP